jgi:hypothetical protein
MTDNEFAYFGHFVTTGTQAMTAYSLEIESLVAHKHRLEADNERLRKELKWISTDGDLWSRQVALAALDPKP